MKKGSMIFGICFLLIGMIGFVSAELYFYGSDDASVVKFDSTSPLWSTTLKTNDGNQLTISFLEVKSNYTPNDGSIIYSNTENLLYLNDGIDEYLTLPLILEDVKWKSYFWGCLKGATFTQSFKTIFDRVIKGEDPVSIVSSMTPEERKEFDLEQNHLANTPGTGAFNTVQCFDLCNKEIENKGRCYLSDICPLSVEDRLNYENCRQECAIPNNCGGFYESQTFAPNGLPGIKSIEFQAKEKYPGKININPLNGKIIIKGSTINKQNIIVLKESGDIYLSRI